MFSDSNLVFISFCWSWKDSFSFLKLLLLILRFLNIRKFSLYLWHFAGRGNASEHRSFGSAQARALLTWVQIWATAAGHCQQHQPSGLLIRQQEQLRDEHLAAQRRRHRRTSRRLCSSGNKLNNVTQILENSKFFWVLNFDYFPLKAPMTRTDSFASEDVSNVESDYEGELESEKVHIDIVVQSSKVICAWQFKSAFQKVLTIQSSHNPIVLVLFFVKRLFLGNLKSSRDHFSTPTNLQTLLALSTKIVLALTNGTLLYNCIHIFSLPFEIKLKVCFPGICHRG